MATPPVGRDLSHYYRNVCIELEKALKETKDIDELQMHFEHFLNANKRVGWPHKASDHFHKDEIEKAVQKVVSTYERYYEQLQKADKEANPQDILDALSVVKTMSDQLKGR